MSNPEAGESLWSPREKHGVFQHIAKFYVAKNGIFSQVASDGAI